MRPELVPVPSIEITKDGDAEGTWCPLQEGDVTIWLLLKAIFVVGSGNLIDAAFCSLENIQPPK